MYVPQQAAQACNYKKHVTRNLMPHPNQQTVHSDGFPVDVRVDLL